jgi:hypothetical protein
MEKIHKVAVDTWTNLLLSLLWKSKLMQDILQLFYSEVAQLLRQKYREHVIIS